MILVVLVLVALNLFLGVENADAIVSFPSGSTAAS